MTRFIKSEGLFWAGILKGVKKSPCRLQPIFEALTNSLESIALAAQKDLVKDGYVSLNFFYNMDAYSNRVSLSKISIEDNGIGFDNDNFNRVKTYKDDRKGFNNKGSGRIQFLHFFSKTIYDSCFATEKGKYRVKFALSKSPSFLMHNSILKILEEEDIEMNCPLKTVATFIDLLDEKDCQFYVELSIDELKQDIIHRYLLYLCTQRNKLPKIHITFFNGVDVSEERDIESTDIPEYDKEKNIKIPYSKMSSDMKRIDTVDESADFKLVSYKISSDKLKRNEIKLTSKEEIVENIKIHLDGIGIEDEIDNIRYLFLLSSPYIDTLDSDTRGDIELLNKTDYKKKAKECGQITPQVLVDDIEEHTNKLINSIYDEIREKSTQHMSRIAELKERFLLKEETINNLKFNLNDSDEKVLEKIYEADAKQIATQDAEISEVVKSINILDTTSETYSNDLEKKVKELVKVIPLQNRTSLTQYVARRKIVLDLFQKILDKEIEKLKNGGRLDEDILHNLIFQQSSDKPDESDLWIINEEFIYFKGFSEKPLNSIALDGNRVFDKKFSEEDKRYLNSLGEKRLSKRPDIMLFPSEGKCIIIEFKAPDVNVAEHLTQIDFYASLFRNYTRDDLCIDTFYGYLIGESIEDRDVRGRVTRFEHSPHFNYWFRPSENVIDFSGKNNGSIYIEVLKFSTLLERAKMRNKIFIDKLTEVSKPKQQ
jgi:hypothetical protein